MNAARAWPVLASGAVILGGWQAGVRLFDVRSFILPAPTDVAGALVRELPTILGASRVTVAAVLLGLTMGAAAGVLSALLLSRFRSAAPPLMATAVVLNCAPIVALAPIFNNWFGVTSLMSKAGVAAVMVFFPVLTNTARGLLEVSPAHLELMRSVAAGQRQVSLLLRLPSALPYLFSALRLGSTLAVIGVIVTEYFGGPTNALGVYIAYQAALPRFAEAWAGIVVASALGLTLFGSVAALERIAMPWHPSLRPTP